MTQAQIFEFTGGKGLTPLVVPDIPIGQRVYHSGYRSGEAVVCSRQSTGYEIIFPDGHSCQNQRPGTLSGYTRIELLEGIASPEEVAELIRKRDQKRIDDENERKQKASQHAADTERIKKELQEKYPWTAGQNNLRGYARASKNIKIELAKVFPGVKFSVRSSSFSMGNSVDITWTDGPTTKEVDKIVNKYQQGNFNGMIDLYEDDHSAYGEAVSQVLGRAKYVSTQRNYTEGLHEAIGRALCGLQNVEFVSLNQCDLFGENTSDNLQWYVWQLLSDTSIPVGAQFVGTAHAGEGAHGWNEWATLLFETPQTAPKPAETHPCPMCATPLNLEGNQYRCTCGFKFTLKTQPVTITENKEKGGIEIRFADKPADDILASLKANGWKWSRFNKCWYAKASDKSRAFAQSLK